MHLGCNFELISLDQLLTSKRKHKISLSWHKDLIPIQQYLSFIVSSTVQDFNLAAGSGMAPLAITHGAKKNQNNENNKNVKFVLNLLSLFQ
jgi:hypothetical protein